MPNSSRKWTRVVVFAGTAFGFAACAGDPVPDAELASIGAGLAVIVGRVGTQLRHLAEHRHAATGGGE